jgi:hypothetical protein
MCLVEVHHLFHKSQLVHLYHYPICGRWQLFCLKFYYYRWLSFCSHESSLHKVFTWFLLIFFFFWLYLLYILICVVLLMVGSHPWFLFTRFFFYLEWANTIFLSLSFGMNILKNKLNIEWVFQKYSFKNLKHI